MTKKIKTSSDFPEIEMGYCNTPWGQALIEYSDHVIYSFEFLNDFDPKQVTCSFAQNIFKSLIKDPSAFVFRPIGTSFQKDVWNALLKIPKGELRSYTEVAKMIGRPKSVRAVANAIGANPICIFIPCHRVIRSDGSLGGFSSGIHRKKALLEMEGINPPNEGLSSVSPSKF
jgi:O-6-methylguanine DNA methyltransferase